MGTRLEPADHREHSRAKDRLIQEFWHVGHVCFARGVCVLSEPVFGHVDRQVEQLDVLDDFELVGWRELEFANIGIFDFVENLFVDPLGRQRLAQLSLVAFLSAPFGFLAPIGLLRRRLHDIARRRFRRVGRVFQRLGELQFQFGNAVILPLDLLSQIGNQLS